MAKIKIFLVKFIHQIHKTKQNEQQKKHENLDSIEAVIAKYEELLGR